MSKKSLVEIGRRAIKPSDSSSGELALCAESEFDDELAVRLDLMFNVCTRQDFSLKTMTIEKHLIWICITCVSYLSRAFVCGRLRKDRHLFTVAPKVFTVAPKLVYCGPQTCLLWPQNLFTVAPKLV